ncbi:ubiquinone biosynthesis regulatory protein kinase UbiB [Actinobacillus delphinicola]|uniref:Probable protein kinase UbiB n=1 Tax=Actinobacillus delphinicola TaxID=51161 RepID=A0A448TSX4_9PAST|nr:ubiquinone biosynthesis regulatory protein kinase UbiB [Actinobacillus delphinicola]VEJ08888.1 ubiquinone biosynthesis protein [Actinobacillus delphinicola]
MPKTFANSKRLYHILRTFLRYGLDEKLPKQNIILPFKLGRKLIFWEKNQYPDLAYGVRLRYALQELGPVWIKFGQMLSTRRELFPPEIANELALLQDKVPPFSGVLARAEIEKSLGGKLETWFCDFDEIALASASLAQVHTAKFNATQPNAGKEIVIKILRPDIREKIQADLELMHQCAEILLKIAPESYRLRPVEVVKEYEKTLNDELDLRVEMKNAQKLRHNFLNSDKLYIPEMYPQFAHQNMIVMERIYGIPVGDIEALKTAEINLPILAERGVEVFFTQVFRDSFFHADMHAGNIFVNPDKKEDPQYIAVDCGIVGYLNEKDKRYLAESFVGFFNRDYRLVAEMHVAAGWTPPDTDINAFEAAFRQVCEPIFEKSLSEISFGEVLMNLFNVARDFNMQVQPQLVLLQKTMLYVEGLGRQLDPHLDLWKTAKPFLQNWLEEQMSLKKALNKLKVQLPFLQEHLPDMPVKFIEALEQQKNLSYQLIQINKQLIAQQKWQKKVLLLVSSGVFFLAGLWQFQTSSSLMASVFWLMSVCFFLFGWRR